MLTLDQKCRYFLGFEVIFLTCIETPDFIVSVITRAPQANLGPREKNYSFRNESNYKI